jgi:Rps23 Pro-64 3,4-dihydroxylase Tpa1-like proline 4-hydroxylase
MEFLDAAENARRSERMKMATATITAETARLFPYERWRTQLPELAKQYRAASPFPYIHLTDFLEPAIAQAVADEFPQSNSSAWIQYKHFNENKAGLTKREMFPPLLGKLADELNSAEFLAWLSDLTAIPSLLADPTLEGGGLHQSGRGGFLNVHADFTMHHHEKNWRRRINLILYLNPDWQPQWGGAIELWDEQMKHPVASVAPLLNHALIFNTTDTSYHGFPEKVACPENVSRKSLALYYYTLEQDSSYVARSTNYQARPADSKSKAALIWLDKKAVHLYSRMKETLGIGDDFASKVLGFFSRRK